MGLRAGSQGGGAGLSRSLPESPSPFRLQKSPAAQRRVEFRRPTAVGSAASRFA